MDLLTTLSGMTPDTATASMAAVARAVAGDEHGHAGEQGEDFLDVLTSLLGPLPEDGDAAADLAAAVAELEDAAARELHDAVATVWPLALLAAGEAAARQRSLADVATVGDGAEDGDAAADLVGEVADRADGDGADVPRAADADAGAVLDDAADGSSRGPGAPISEDEPQVGSLSPLDEAASDAAEGGSDARASDASAVRTTSRGDAPAPVVDAAALRGQQAAAADEADADVPAVQRASTRPVTHAEPVADAARPSAGPVTDAPPAPQTSGSTGPTAGTPAMADGVRRVLEAIELLENAPPPRQLTIEIGEARVRVSLEEGQVRLSVMEGGSDDVDELLAAAEDALAQQGFDLGGDGSDEGTPDGDPTTTTTSGESRPRTWSADRGLRL